MALRIQSGIRFQMSKYIFHSPGANSFQTMTYLPCFASLASQHIRRIRPHRLPHFEAHCQPGYQEERSHAQ